MSQCPYSSCKNGKKCKIFEPKNYNCINELEWTTCGMFRELEGGK
jgi:hypothetical protein